MKFSVSKGLLSLFIFLFLFAGCKSSVESKAPVKLIFNVDSTRIAPAVIDDQFKITYSPPINWNLVSPGIMDKLKQTVQTNTPDSQLVTITPVAFYSTDSLSGILSVSSISFSDNSLKYSVLMDKYKNLLTSRFGEKNLKAAEYLKDELHITQYLIEKENQIIFKILFPNPDNNFIQFDYIAERKAYINMIKSIESSIGSIHYK